MTYLPLFHCRSAGREREFNPVEFREFFSATAAPESSHFVFPSSPSPNIAVPGVPEGEHAQHVHPERMPESLGMTRTLDPIRSQATSGPTVRKYKWHLGIRSQSKPMDIMHEVFRAMKTLDYEWKLINHFHARVRKWNPVKKRYIKLMLQLYQVS